MHFLILISCGPFQIDLNSNLALAVESLDTSGLLQLIHRNWCMKTFIENVEKIKFYWIFFKYLIQRNWFMKVFIHIIYFWKSIVIELWRGQSLRNYSLFTNKLNIYFSSRRHSLLLTPLIFKESATLGKKNISI